METTNKQQTNYQLNVIASNKEIRTALKTVNGALKAARELTTNTTVLQKIKFLLKGSTGEQFQQFSKTVRVNKDSSTCVFYVLQALNKYETPKAPKAQKAPKAPKKE